MQTHGQYLLVQIEKEVIILRTFRALLIGGASLSVLAISATLGVLHELRHYLGPAIVSVVAAILLVALVFWLAHAVGTVIAKSTGGYIHTASGIYVLVVLGVTFMVGSLIVDCGPGHYVQVHSLDRLPFLAGYRGNLLTIAGPIGGLYMFCFALLFVSMFIGKFVQGLKKRFDRVGEYAAKFEQQSKDKLKSIKKPKFSWPKRSPREPRPAKPPREKRGRSRKAQFEEPAEEGQQDEQPFFLHDLQSAPDRFESESDG